MNKKKLRVATMTFHLAHNYGAMLQAYALEKAINKMGFSCEVLDYRFPYINQWSGIFDRKDFIQQRGLIRGTITFLHACYIGYYSRQSTVHKRFNQFMRHNLRRSHKVYFNSESLKQASYDVFVLGSDQIWNPALTNGIAPEYFGHYFDNKKSRLISYAASCGKDSYPIELKNKILPFLQRFHNISVRESSFSQFLREECGLASQPVLDPVFLLDLNDWDMLLRQTKARIASPYILLYAFDVDNEIYLLAKRIAKERKLTLVSVGYTKNDNWADAIQYTDCGPIEFLSLLRNADFVCTSSFHGEALSIIFERNFYCFGHPEYSQRNYDLLAQFNLTNRMVSSSDAVLQITDCDYSAIRNLVLERKQQSLAFLRSAISSNSCNLS